MILKMNLETLFCNNNSVRVKYIRRSSSASMKRSKDKRSATSFRNVSVASWSGVQVRVGLSHTSCSARVTPRPPAAWRANTKYSRAGGRLLRKLCASV